MIYLILGYIVEESDCNIILNRKAIILIWNGITLIEASLTTVRIWYKIFITIILKSQDLKPRRPK